MRSTAAFMTLAALLGVSLLVNGVLISRLSRTDSATTPPAAPARKPAEPATAWVRPQEASVPVSAGSPVAPPAAAPTAGQSAAPQAPTPPAVPASSVRNDPKLAEILDAQEKFGAFWKDLDKLVKAKSRLEETHYFQSAIAATADFLELGEPARIQLAEAARSGVAALQRSRQEYEAARLALPPKDKANAAAYAAYQEQKKAVDARYQAQVKAATDPVRATVDKTRPRHAEFAAQADKWLRNLVPPKPSQP